MMRSKSGVIVLSMLVIGGFLAQPVEAFVFEELANGTSEQIELNLLNQISNQFVATISSNPFNPNTYSVTLFGMNPNYTGPTEVIFDTQTFENMLTDMVSGSTYNYVYGWSNGESMERYNDVLYISSFTSWCSSAPFFSMPIISTGPPPVYETIDSTTCNHVLDTMGNFIYTQFFSSPTQVPGF